MGIFDSINEFFKGAGKFLDDLNEKSTIYLEESRISSRAEEVIKTDNFSGDMERTIMLAAGEREKKRKSELAAKLASDPVLLKLFSEALGRIHASVAIDTVRGVRLADEAAMSSAVRQRSLHSRLEEDPQFRKAYQTVRETLFDADIKEMQARTLTDPSGSDEFCRDPKKDGAGRNEKTNAFSAEEGAACIDRSSTEGQGDTLLSLFQKIRDGGEITKVAPANRQAPIINLGLLDSTSTLPPGKLTSVILEKGPLTDKPIQLYSWDQLPQGKVTSLVMQKGPLTDTPIQLIKRSESRDGK